MKFFKLISVSLIILLTFSCSSDKKKKENAVSVFADVDLIKVDDSLKNIPIKIPGQKNNSSWFGSYNDNNSINENLAFTGKINKIRSINAGYRPGYNDRMVFAPVIVKDKIYLLDANSNLTARNLSDYKKIWKTKIVKRWFLKNFTNGKISYFDGKIFAVTGYNLIVALDAENGKILWTKEIGAIPISAGVADSDQVFVITNDNKTYAFNAKTGDINWVHSGILRATGILGAANPVFYKNYVIVSYSSGEIYTLNKRNGEVGWTYDLNLSKAINSDFILNDVDATPVIKDDVVYAIGNGGLMMAIAIKSGSVLWQKELASISDFWIAGDFIYLVNNENQLICLAKKSGKVKWFVQLKKYLRDKKPDSRIVYNGVIMAGDNLILTNSNRELLVVSPIDGTILKTKKLDQKIYHNPIIVNKKLYLHTIGRFSVDLKVAE